MWFALIEDMMVEQVSRCCDSMCTLLYSGDLVISIFPSNAQRNQKMFHQQCLDPGELQQAMLSAVRQPLTASKRSH